MIFTNELGEQWETVKPLSNSPECFVIRPYKKPDNRKIITVKATLVKRDESEYVSDYVGLQFDSRNNVIWIKKEELLAESHPNKLNRKD